MNKLYEKGMEGDVRALERFIGYADDKRNRQHVKRNRVSGS